MTVDADVRVAQEIVRWLRFGPPWVVQQAKDGKPREDPCAPNVGLDTVADMIESRWCPPKNAGPT